jgi:hypothetical protein
LPPPPPRPTRTGAGFGGLGLFVSLEAQPTAASISLDWAVPLLMNAGVNHVPSMALMLDKYDVVTLGESIEMALDMFVPLFWVTKLLQRDEVGWYQTAKGELDSFYPKQV